VSSQPPTSPQEVARSKTVIRHTLEVLGLVLLVLLLWRIAHAILLIFAGALLAVLLRGLARLLRERTRLPMGWALGAVVLALAATVVAAGVALGPSIAERSGELAAKLNEAVDRVEDYLRRFALGRHLADAVEESASGGGAGGLSALGSITGTVSKTVNALVAMLVVVFAGVFFATSPQLYTEGLVRLLPRTRQARAREVIDAAGSALWKWLLGQFVTMAVVGTITAVGLHLLGVPLAPMLGAIAALCNFVPYLGPIVAAIPATLLALMAGPQAALYTLLLFFVVQQLEGNVLTPIIQRHAVTLPPVLILFGAVAAGLLFGVAGVVLASPLTVVAMVVVKMLYQEDVLGQATHVPGRDEEAGAAG
jgi:predicted PurR-regulated permease PerM